LDTVGRYQKLKLLINQEFSIKRGEQSLEVFGVDDYLTGIPTTPPTRSPLKDGVSKRIILSHNPDYISALLKRPEHSFSLALCGHTHGGQVVLPIVGPIAAQVVDRRFISGLHNLDNRIVYTSRGLGVVGLPFRLDCPPEVSVFTLRAA
jgi:predicted MPP superfamily phosphohydrolase